MAERRSSVADAATDQPVGFPFSFSPTSSLCHQAGNSLDPSGLRPCYPLSSRGAVAQFGRAPEWHSGGRRFDPVQLHQFLPPATDLADLLIEAMDRIEPSTSVGGSGGAVRPPPQQPTDPSPERSEA